MTKRDLLIFLFKWKASIIGFFLVSVGCAVTVAFFRSPAYVATSKVLVERHRPPVMGAVLSQSMDLAEALNTEAEILRSRTVMAAVVDQLKPHERPPRATTVSRTVDRVTTWLEDAGLLYAVEPREHWIQLLQRQVKVEPSIDASILHVSFAAGDPQWAAKLVNAILDQYLAHHVRVFSVTGSAELYQGRMESIEADLRRRRTELAALKQRLSLSAVQETQRDLVRQAGDLDNQITTAQSELDALLVRFEAGHQEVRLAEGKLKRLKSAARLAREHLGRLETHQGRIGDMQLEIASLEATFRDYSKRHDEARLADLASANSLNVKAVDYAAVPGRPTNSPLSLIVLSAGGGLVLSLLIAFVREYFDRRLADPAAAEDILGIPYLGSAELLPRPTPGRRLGHWGKAGRGSESPRLRGP